MTLYCGIFRYLLAASKHMLCENRANPLVTEEEWAEKSNQITAEHKKAGACDQLLVGWKQWLAGLCWGGVCCC